jgi:hypothetical protein
LNKRLALLIVLATAASARCEVRVFVADSNGVATVNYECTGGEIVRAFALDVSVDRGQVVGIADFFRGQGVAGATGYGIFPASLRNQLPGAAGTNIDWNAVDYTPLANAQDLPGGTLPGLNSSGVTLEFGGLWDPNLLAAVPGSAGMLCSLKLSQGAKVSIAPNLGRGGVVSAIPGALIAPVFSGELVGPAIITTTVGGGSINILFKGGELQTADSIDGEWTATGNVSGNYTEPVGTNQLRFYRVRAP